MGGDLYWLAVDHDQERWQAVMQPDSQLSKALGIEVAEVGPGRSLVRLVVHPSHLDTNRHTLHESVYAALAHRCMGLAVRSTGRRAVTLNLQIGYVRPVEIGQVVECRGMVIYGGRQLVVTGAKMCVASNLVATAGGMFCVEGSDCPE